MEMKTRYRPIPFWSWNDKINPEECRRQVRLMHKAGLGGFFIHARGGLLTGYMSEEWFSAVGAAVDEAEKCGLAPWLYDENGWPSGSGNGRVCELDSAFCQKKLQFEKGEKHTAATIANIDGWHFYYTVNPYYIDVLDPGAVRAFVASTYEPYYQRFGARVAGFFTDEPQLAQGEYPWSFKIERAYRDEYGDELLPRLPELYFSVGEFRKTRVRFWRLITEMFSQSYFKQIYDWCDCRGLQFTGHLLGEETPASQIAAAGAVMPHYAYFHMPGVDFLGRDKNRAAVPLQAASAAHQLGKRQVLTESFALCGHGIGHEELKAIAEVQMVRGVTTICQHLQGYSLKGLRKRDYPPALHYQQPWWESYSNFNDKLAEIGQLLSAGRAAYDTLLIHPQTEAWALYDGTQNQELLALCRRFSDAVAELEKKHLLFHLGDEILLARHAKVEQGTLIVGEQRYSTVILLRDTLLLDSTKKLLSEFCDTGGRVLRPEEAAAAEILDNADILFTKRIFPNGSVYYFVNTRGKSQKATIKIEDQQYPQIFAPYESKILTGADKPAPSPQLRLLPLAGEWRIEHMQENIMTLDYCDYYFDGNLIEKNGYVLNVQKRALDLKRPVTIRCDFKFQVNDLPKRLFLICETPEQFDIQVNTVRIEKTDCGFFRDIAFRKLDISQYVRLGENILSLTVHFCQTAETMRNIENAEKFESVKNKLTYDMEIEAVYLAGDFFVETEGGYTKENGGISRFSGNFALGKPRTYLKLSEIEKQGLQFFAGTLTISREIVLEDTRYALRFHKRGINVLQWYINDKPAGTFLWPPYDADVSHLLQKGKNRITLTLTNSLRNMLGPHHSLGDEGMVGPSSFFPERTMWNFPRFRGWDSRYSFLEMSVEQAEEDGI